MVELVISKATTDMEGSSSSSLSASGVAFLFQMLFVSNIAARYVKMQYRRSHAIGASLLPEQPAVSPLGIDQLGVADEISASYP